MPLPAVDAERPRSRLHPVEGGFGPSHGGRVVGLDALRLLGLMLVVLAHVRPPGWLFELRNFDVPMLVMLSGAAAALAPAERRQHGWFARLALRGTRLVLPMWVFFAGFFGTWSLVAAAQGEPLPYRPRVIAETFTMVGNGIGYVWIIRVFLIVALAMPLVLWLHRQGRPTWFFLGMVAVAETAFETIPDEWLVALCAGQKEIALGLFAFGVPYIGLAAVGTRLPQMKRTDLLVGAALMALVLGIYAWRHGDATSWLKLQEHKYPPEQNYVWYGVACTMLLVVAVREVRRWPAVVQRVVAFGGRASLWIYLWHIAILSVPAVQRLPGGWALKFVVVLGGAALLTAGSQAAARWMLARLEHHPRLAWLWSYAWLK